MWNFCPVVVRNLFCIFFSDYSFVTTKFPLAFASFFSDYSFATTKFLFVYPNTEQFLHLWFYQFFFVVHFQQKVLLHNWFLVRICCTSGKCFHQVMLYVRYLEGNVNFLLKKSNSFVKNLYFIPSSGLNLDLWAFWWW